MLGRAGTKMPNSRKMLDGTDIEKASLTQYVRRGWHENLFSLKILGEVGIKKPFNLTGGAGMKKLFTLIMLPGTGIGKAPLTQYVRRG